MATLLALLLPFCLFCHPLQTIVHNSKLLQTSPFPLWNNHSCFCRADKRCCGIMPRQTDQFWDNHLRVRHDRR